MMDETPMSHALEAADFAGSAAPEEESSGGAGARFSGVPWRSYTRCLLIAAVVAAAGWFAFRPGMLRLSIILSHVSPSRGEGLAWRPDDGEAVEGVRRAPGRYTVPVEEWRVSAGGGRMWFGERTAGDGEDRWQGGELGVFPWKRESFNPWSWSDDSGRKHAARVVEESGDAPAQKPASMFRAADSDPWASVPGTREPAGGKDAAPAFAGAGQERVPSIAPLQLPPAPLQLPPLSPPPSLPPPSPAPAPSLRPPESAPPAAPAPSEAPAEPAAPAESPDWKAREITGSIPGAYLTIYPKLNFVGLCVPGQGYIRKYNQIAVPSDLTRPKLGASDGRTPYGKYFVVSHVRDAASGPRLLLSWPSVEDARRAGADAAALDAVERAWDRRQAPPGDTPAGGGLALSGDRDRVDATSGGFSLEPPHMEEIFTALPDGAWVFVQQ